MPNDAFKPEPEENAQPAGRQEPETVLHLGPIVAPATNNNPSDEETLTGFIAKAAHETAEHSPKPVVLPEAGGSIPADRMLGVVSYCYTKGVYGSEDIGRELSQEPLAQQVAHGDVPRPEDIRRFRRLNREAIQKTVEKALAFARTKVVEAWAPTNPFRNAPSSGPVVESMQVDARRDASERIDKATFIDGMSM